MRNCKNGGYAGLVIILITVAIMALILWKSGFFGALSATGTGPLSPELQRGEGRTTPQEDLQALQKARDLKASLEERYR